MKGQPRLQKVVALALLLKHRLGRDATLRDYSTNKIRKVLGVSASTINKYMPMLVNFGFVSFTGKQRQHLVVCNLSSNTSKRNIRIDSLCYDTFKDVLNSLRSLIILVIQAKKDFIKRTIQIATNPEKWEDFKAARKLVKRLVKQGVIRDIYSKYEEWGLSYKRMAREIGNCARTAFSVMKYALQKGWVKKHNNFEQIIAPKVFYYNIEGYTFSTKNNIYLVHANTYELMLAIY